MDAIGLSAVSVLGGEKAVVREGPLVAETGSAWLRQ